MEKGGTLTSWVVFLHELRKRFGTSIYDDPLGKIAKLVQLGKVSQYRAEFESQMTKITRVPDSMFLNFFVWGLKTEIRREILVAQPDDLSGAMAKAELFEDRNEDLLGCHRRERISNNGDTNSQYHSGSFGWNQAWL